MFGVRGTPRLDLCGLIPLLLGTTNIYICYTYNIHVYIFANSKFAYYRCDSGAVVCMITFVVESVHNVLPTRQLYTRDYTPDYTPEELYTVYQVVYSVSSLICMID